MVEIGAATKHRIAVAVATPAKNQLSKSKGGTGTSSATNKALKGIGSGIGKGSGTASSSTSVISGGGKNKKKSPPLSSSASTTLLTPAVFATPEAIQNLLYENSSNRSVSELIQDLVRTALGCGGGGGCISTSNAAASAAADVAVAARELGMAFVWQTCGVKATLFQLLLPQQSTTKGAGGGGGGMDMDVNGLTTSVSAMSLVSMGNYSNNNNNYSNTVSAAASFAENDDASSIGTSYCNGVGGSAGGILVHSSSCDNLSLATAEEEVTSQTPSSANRQVIQGRREGCLLLIRAICQIVGRKAEPYLLVATNQSANNNSNNNNTHNDDHHLQQNQAGSGLSSSLLALALQECSSASSTVRTAAEDTTSALIALAHPWAFQPILAPTLLACLQPPSSQPTNNNNNTKNISTTAATSTTIIEWRVQVAALDRLRQCCSTAPAQVEPLLPTLIPVVTRLAVNSTQPKVRKAAQQALLAICATQVNPDVPSSLIPVLVEALCHPASATATQNALSELLGTTFVQPVTASTLALLCPILARALQKNAAAAVSSSSSSSNSNNAPTNNASALQRSTCLVIANMSQLVQSPRDIQPFQSRLVPALQHVCNHAQFADVRDAALKALRNLTQALGNLYEDKHPDRTNYDDSNGVGHNNDDSPQRNIPPKQKDKDSTTTTHGPVSSLNIPAADAAAALAQAMREETARVEAEQERLRRVQQQEAQRLLEQEQTLAHERKQFKEAMDAQRQLDQIQHKVALEQKQAQVVQREMQKCSTKSAQGTCQGCGLKKCKKTCPFCSSSR